MSTEFNKISAIGLDSAQYGEDLNARLGAIDGNFKFLSENAFLKGEKGDSILVDSVTVKNELSEYYLNGEKVNLFEAITTAIVSEEDNTKINGKQWHSDLDGLTIQVLYTKFEGANGDEKHIQSIFPFTYIDSRFKNLDEVDTTNYQAVTDHSCSVSMDASGFVAYQNTPTIFWNTERKEFCWKINGNQTDIVCKGPAGADGLPGSTYVVYVGKDRNPLPVDETQQVRNVLCVLGWYQEGGTYKYGQITPGEFDKYGIKLETGLSVFAFPAEKVGEGYKRILDNGQSICMISQVLKLPKETTGEYQYYVYSNDTDQLIFQMLKQTNLKSMLDGIGDYGDGSVRGLYVRSNDPEESGVVSGHMMWADGKTLNMGHVGDVTTLSSDPDQSTLQLNYNTISLNSPDDNIVKLLPSQTFDMSCDWNINVQSDAELNLKSTDAINLDSYDVNINGHGATAKIGDSHINLKAGEDSISLLDGGISIQSSDDIVIHSQGGSIDLKDASKVKFETPLTIGEKMKDKQIKGQFTINPPFVQAKEVGILGASLMRKGNEIDQKLYGSYNVVLNIVDPGLSVKWYSYLPSNYGDRPIGGKMYVHDVEVYFYDENNNLCGGYDEYRQTIIDSLEDYEFSPGSMVEFYTMSTVANNESDFSLVINVFPDGQNQVLTEISVAPNSTNLISIPPSPHNIRSMDLVSRVKIGGSVVPHKAKIQAQYDVDSAGIYDTQFEMTVNTIYSVYDGDYGTQTISYECERNTWPRLTVWKDNGMENLELGLPECNSYLHIDSSNIILRYSKYGIKLSNAGIQYTNDVDDNGEGGSDRWHSLI